ncbi:hypothetical protein [Duganella radicis]|uniref:DUF3757 domain-containing protein n=1 Tax=Duganella radicis TaxID=551988 RepID=A0A6L6PHK3_9BURK|nr:hypothetical protein [Duganella radicis]MTV38051.1 hypothetical protein [Duganella radicis]
MRCVRIIAAANLAFATLEALAQGLPLPSRFQATGRACQGELVIQRQAILWSTPFSVCKAASYKLLDHENNTGLARYTYRLDQTTSACRYHVISLTHDGSKPEDIGWEVTGYYDPKSYEQDKAAGFPNGGTPDMMSCYLTRTFSQRPRP